MLQDPNYNVVALVSDGDGSLSRGEVARQYSWSPYGQLLRADIYDTSAPMSRLGHQGLFHDRLDADILAEPMVAFARQAVQVTNRTLLPWLNRFAQQDPNGSGLDVLTSIVQHGKSMGTAIQAASADAMFDDGMSLHGYLGQQPVDRRDPLGLFFYADVSMANDIAADLNADTFDAGMDVFDSIFDTFGIDIDGGSGFIRAGVFFGGFSKGIAGKGGRGARYSQQWTKWTPNDYKHFRKRNVPWKKTVESTRHGHAKYFEMDESAIRLMEQRGWRTGTVVKNDGTSTWKLVNTGSLVGAHSGKETSWMVLKVSGGALHGHPVSPAEARRLLKLAEGL